MEPLLILLGALVVVALGAAVAVVWHRSRSANRLPAAEKPDLIEAADSQEPAAQILVVPGAAEKPEEGETPQVPAPPSADKAGQKSGFAPEQADETERDQVDLDRAESEADRAEAEAALETAPEPAKEAEAAPQLEKPQAAGGRFQRLRERLARSGGFGRQLLSVFSRGDLQIEDWEEIEDTLLMADLGVEATDELMEELRTQAKILNTSDPEVLKQVLRDKLVQLVNPELDRRLQLEQDAEHADQPGVVLVVGVNGTGKTTTVGKISRLLVAEDKKVVLGAGDTFRAAGAQQLQTWGERIGVPVVASEKAGADPASVAFDAVKTGIDSQADVVLVDTAGRLQNKKGLMDELGKVKRVMQKNAPITETLLVIDATTGQNGMQQAKVFAEVVPLSGIVLTKLDGTAKGGIVISVQRELGIPVKLVGLGEGPDDLAPFDPEGFVDALLNLV